MKSKEEYWEAHLKVMNEVNYRRRLRLPLPFAVP
ncbi:Uncharacterised protein [Legionella feeleii]|uniref:Uncharacterized protein n=1 Tax=Legionella feeleii TaxID=453 RepID=A0A378IXZ4_9GAMM|nr:Uncharacterised protein [Legionella feeleii]